MSFSPFALLHVWIYYLWIIGPLIVIIDTRKEKRRKYVWKLNILNIQKLIIDLCSNMKWSHDLGLVWLDRAQWSTSDIIRINESVNQLSDQRQSGLSELNMIWVSCVMVICSDHRASTAWTVIFIHFIKTSWCDHCVLASELFHCAITLDSCFSTLSVPMVKMRVWFLLFSYSFDLILSHITQGRHSIIIQ